MMTERWRAEAKKVVLEVHDAMQFQDEQGAVEFILELIECVQQETRQSIAAAIADRVDMLRGAEAAVYAHAVSIALTEGAGAASPYGRCGAQQPVAITCIPYQPDRRATATCDRLPGHLTSHEGEALGSRWWWNQHGYGILRGAADRLAASPSVERQDEDS